MWKSNFRRDVVPVTASARAATLDDLREAVTTLEDAERIARRVFESAHPDVVWIERHLQKARAALRDRETPLGFRVVGGGEKLVNDAPCNLGEPS